MFFANAVFAQVQSLRLENISVEDGLAQASVNYIYQDSDGFIWVSTDSGIQAYDGYNFKSILGPEKDFSSFSAYKIDESKDGLIWLDVYGKGLYAFDKNTQTYELMLEADEENAISHFFLGSNETVWIATLTEIGYLDSATKKLIKEIDLQAQLGPKNSIYYIFESNNVLFIGTKNGVFAYQISSKRLVKLPGITPQNSSSGNYRVIEAAKSYALIVIDDTLFIGSNDGVFSLDVSNIEQYFDGEINLPTYNIVIPHLSVWQFYAYQDLLLVGANEGLYQFDVNGQKESFLLSYDLFNSTIANNYVRTLLVDHSGLYWMGSLSDGLFSWDPVSQDVQNFGYQKGSESSLSNNQVSAILPHQSLPNLLWVGTINGLNLIDLDTNRVERILQPADAKLSFTENSIYDLYAGLDNQLWLSTAIGLRLYDIEKKKLIPLPFDESTNQSLSNDVYVAHVEYGYLWFSTDSEFFRVNLASYQVDNFPIISDEIGSNNIWSFLGHISSDPNEFWFTTNLGLWKFNLENQILTNVYQHPDISDGEWSNIDSVTIDEANQMAWIAFTLQGLIGISLETNDVVHYFEQNNSILDKNIYGVQKDKDGDIWVSTHNGIFVLDTRTLHLRRFGVSNGLIGEEFNGNAFATIADGRFVYGAMNGLSLFDPIKLKNNEQPKPLNIVVTDVGLLSRDLAIPFSLKNDATIALEHDDVGIRVDFTTFNFSSVKDALFEYSLNNKGFTRLDENFIVFPNLGSGQHSLQIRAKSRLTGSYSDPTTIKFDVSYAPWRSPIAYSLYAIFLITGLTLWLRKREKQRTQLLYAHEEVKFRENRLQLALKGSNSDVWDWNADNNSFTANRFKKMQQDNEQKGLLSFTRFFSRIHPDDSASYAANWQRFLDSADMSETFNATYRIKGENDDWLWYKDLGKIVELDSKNKPKRVTGSYTNITQKIVDEERAQYYGEAFRQTKDWVLIINQDFTKVTSNAAIREVFGWDKEEFPFDQSILGLEKAKLKFYSNIVLNLGADEHWRGEELVTAANGQEFHVIVNISVGKNSSGGLHYICVFTDITAQKKAENELRYLANYDHLTGLPNRALLFERIEQAMNRAERKKENIGLFFIDLDGFKKINDTLGHSFGDTLLVEISKRLITLFRQDDTIARQGGDEFVILLEHFKSISKLATIAQKVIDIVEQPVKLQETTVSIGCSIGIAVYPDDAQTSSELLRHSDIAMYSAKQNGRNHYQFFESSMNNAAAKRLVQEAKIKHALKEHEFVNHYQPIVDASTGKAIGVELLMRWPTDNGMIPPNEFIPLAEDLNIIIAMTEIATKSALADLVNWRRYRADFHVSINISASHFIKGQLVDFMSSALKDCDLPTSAIRLEVTESAFISDTELAVEQMTHLKKLGIRLSLDDFGTGYSSLSYLKSLPIDVIKIDRGFISNIGKQSADEAIVETIIVLAKNLGMSCIAEGVETKEQLRFLVSRQCHLIQGFLYSKPRPSSEISTLLENDSNASQLFVQENKSG